MTAIPAYYNSKPYEQSVPNEKGADLRIPSYKYVKGNFFDKYVAPGLLTKITDAASVNPQSDIIYTAVEAVIASNPATIKYAWTNSQVVGIGAVLSGQLLVATLAAKEVIKNAYIIISTPGAVVDTLTVSMGHVSSGYVDYVVASDAKAVANTVYGDASGERGTLLTGYDLPSATTTTPIYLRFVATSATAKTLADVTGSTGTAYLEIESLP